MHLDERGESREVLPWIRVAVDLDPHNVANFVVGAYWLRTHMGRTQEAEAFLREGWRANPDSPEILFELGRLFDENRHDPDRARNVWELGLRKWQAWPEEIRREEILLYRNLVARLADLERRAGNRERAVFWLEALKPVSTVPDLIQRQIDELKAAPADGGGADARE